MPEVTPVGDEKGKWTFWFRCEWLDLFSECYWYTLTLFRAEIENEVLLGNVNWTFGLLGFVAGGSYTYKETESLKALKEMVNSLREKE